MKIASEVSRREGRGTQPRCGQFGDSSSVRTPADCQAAKQQAASLRYQPAAHKAAAQTSALAA
jgi:hypothetical protein